ncbi:AraC family transcriptional regulator [Cytobacillus massiliigabonensis]|uniref:AraC family transcriptional regulator n=1 Tax=Cytobacillus massiliigabonensis TaxID=1871011 RepID=UPI000C85607D|nr:AraC family transcriptional regulator [Cytobacillus massiliigabonensis]
MENEDYIKRIEKVIQFIEENSFQPINLDDLASISNFSKYHFSRIFTSIVGLTPIAFVNQKRLQKAAYYLLETNKTVLEISSICGFESVSNFNAIFKRHFNKTPSEARKEFKENSNISLQVSKIQEESSNPLNYYRSNKNNFLWRIWKMNISVKELPEYEVAYVRHIGSYLDTHHAWRKLGIWAEINHLLPANQYFIGISLDDPNMVDEYACRYDACVTIPAEFNKEDHHEVQFKKLSGGLYALYTFYDTIDKFAITYQNLFGQWLPNSEYDADDRPCLEFCMNNPMHDPEGKCKVDLYIPIKQRAVK